MILNGDFVIKPADYEFIQSKNGFKYVPSNQLLTISQAGSDYYFQDIVKEDRVIDIGACIGGFTLPASRSSRSVIAIEPTTPDVLTQNLKLNGISNVKVIDGALGDGGEITIDWNFKKYNKKTTPLSEFIDISGGCDFLKCDCEGGEWGIRIQELNSIRRIEMEIHRTKMDVQRMADRIKDAGFNVYPYLPNDEVIDHVVVHAINRDIVPDVTFFERSLASRGLLEYESD